MNKIRAVWSRHAERSPPEPMQHGSLSEPSGHARRDQWLIAFAVTFIAWGYVSKVFPFPTEDAERFWFYVILAAIVPLVVLVGLAWLRLLLPHDYSLRWPGLLALIRQGLVATAAFCIVIFLIRGWIWAAMWYAGMIGEQQERVFEAVQIRGSMLYLAVDLASGSVVEEIVYRGMLARILRSPTLYILISTLLFAGIHVNQGLFGVAVAGIFGFVACLLFLRWGNIAPLVVGHLAVNAFSLATRSLHSA
jgi:hypothetical protein